MAAGMYTTSFSSNSRSHTGSLRAPYEASTMASTASGAEALIDRDAFLRSFEASDGGGPGAAVGARGDDGRCSALRRCWRRSCPAVTSRIEIQIGCGLGLTLASMGLLVATVNIYVAVVMAVLGGWLGFQLGRHMGRLVTPPSEEARPIRRAALGKLPSSIVSADSFAASGFREACSVCLEEFLLGDDQRRLPCLHSFHRGCVDEWLESTGQCPVCRHDVAVNGMADEPKN